MLERSFVDLPLLPIASRLHIVQNVLGLPGKIHQIREAVRHGLYVMACIGFEVCPFPTQGCLGFTGVDRQFGPR